MGGIIDRLVRLRNSAAEHTDRIAAVNAGLEPAGAITGGDPRCFAGQRYPLPEGPLRLHLACGAESFDGWLNIDLDPVSCADVLLDLTKPLPFEDEVVDCIHCEDFIELIPLGAAQSFLAECFRVLAPGNWMRILTPDLRKFAANYLSGDAEQMGWYARNHGCRTPAEAFNLGMRTSGQVFLYDEETLRLILEEAGFEVLPAGPNQSACPEMCGIDVHGDAQGISICWDCRKPPAETA